MKEASVEYEIGFVRVEFPYDADLIDELKELVPGSQRTFDWDTKTWTINDEWWDRAKALIEDHYPISD